MRRALAGALVIALLLVLGGCSSHPQRCHGPLQPINPQAASAESADER